MYSVDNYKTFTSCCFCATQAITVHFSLITRFFIDIINPIGESLADRQLHVGHQGFSVQGHSVQPLTLVSAAP